MRLVRSAHTGPEITVRRMLHRMGYRYRLHRSELPGTPDLVFSSRRKVIFVNGCFWHQHSCTRGSRVPASRRSYWLRKLRRNRARDAVNLKRLKAMGWFPIVVWECQLKNPSRTARRLRTHLGGLGG
jgi:DNA mismatch endonuclease, patch repair protein